MNESTHHNKKSKIGTNRRCDNKDTTVKVFLKETGREAKFKFLDHIFSCPDCLAEFNVLKEVWKSENSLMDRELELKLKELNQLKHSRKLLLLSPLHIAAVAAVLIAAVLSFAIATHNRPEQLPLERDVGSEIFKTIEPEGAIDYLPVLFQWSSVRDASEYTIEVLDAGLEVIYRKEGILVPSFALPDKIFTQSQVSRTYFWKVIATLTSELRIESEFGKFYLTER